MHGIDSLIQTALDLTTSLMAEDRYRRLIDAVASATPSDAACLLRFDDGTLVPLAARGLVPEIVGRRFVAAEHPRLQVITSSRGPVQFPADSQLPDPFDGLVEGDADALHDIHACVGCPLYIDEELVGVLTLDALEPKAFDGLDSRLLTMLAALAAAALRTSSLIEALEESAAHQGMVARELLRETASAQGAETMIGTSSAMQRLRQEIDLVARTDFPVLIRGESGTGKELVARAVHAASSRHEHALIHVNCAALPESMAESELFGHVRGAFTGAERDRPGKMSIADEGTLVLDEIGELPLALQPKLLRALQDGEIQRVGDDQIQRVDVRLIASTNRDLEREVQAGRFRADLFHRLNVFPVHVPPLRERREDIAQLMGHFSQQAARRVGCGSVRFSDRIRQTLFEANWTGNVRELRNAISRMVLRASAGSEPGSQVLVDVEHLEGAANGHGSPTAAKAIAPIAADDGPSIDLRAATDNFQRRQVELAVKANDGNWSAAARSLGMHRSNLHHLAKRLGLR